MTEPPEQAHQAPEHERAARATDDGATEGATGRAAATPAPPGVRWGTPTLPREHGAWAMLVAPPVIGGILAGISWLHLLLLGGLVAGYMSVGALLQYVRAAPRRRQPSMVRWSIVYATIAAFALALPVWREPALLWIGALATVALPVDVVFVRLRRERALINGIISVMALTTGLLAAYQLGAGQLDRRALVAWLLCVLFFVGSLLFVKSMIRRRGDRSFLWGSASYHAAVVAALAALSSPLLAVAYVPSLARAVALWGRALRPAVIGAAEATNTIYFVVIIALALR